MKNTNNKVNNIKRGVGKMTIFDVASFAGVSITTVSRVLNSKASVRQETREKVKEAIKELDFSPDERAQQLGSLGRSNKK